MNDSRPLPPWYLAGYAVLALLPALPLFFYPNHPPLFYPRGDIGQTLWNFWWFDQTFWSFRNPYHTDMLFHPFGAWLYLHTFEVLEAFLTTPFRWFGGVELAWKVAFVGHNFWTAVAVHLLARRLGAGNAGAVACAFILMTSTYRTMNVQALSLMATGNAFFLCWAVVACWQEPRNWRRGLWLGFAFVLLLYSNMNYLFFLSMLLPCAGIAALLVARPQREAWTGWAKQLAVAAAVAAIPFLFMAQGIARAQEHLGTTESFPRWYQVRGSAELIQLVMPHWVRNVITGEEVPEEAWALFLPPWRSMSFAPPLIFLAIAGYGLYIRRKATPGGEDRLPRPFRFGLLAVLVAAAFLALGPEIKVWTTFDPADASPDESGGVPARWDGYSVPSPYGFLTELPVFRQIRWNTRCGYFFLAAWVLLMARPFDLAIRDLASRIPSRPAVHMALAALLFGIGWKEHAVPFFATDPQLDHSGFELLRDAPIGAARIYPDEGYVLQGIAMYNQTVHEQPVIGGYLSRDPVGYQEWMRERFWWQALRDTARRNPRGIVIDEPERFLRSAAEDGLRYLVVYPAVLPGRERSHFLSILLDNGLAEPMWQGEQVILLRLTWEENGKGPGEVSLQGRDPDGSEGGI